MIKICKLLDFLKDFFKTYRILKTEEGGNSMKISVAIDGPAGAGKSTIAKILGKKLDLMYINTGSMYRAVTLKALEKDISSDKIMELCNLVDSLTMTFQNDRLYVNGIDVNDELNHPIISQNVSKYAAIKEIRQKLVKMQRDLSKEYSVIMDGRDIGTVVLKDANYKFFLTAAPEERASRRYKELNLKGLDVNYDSILKDMLQRDYEDSNREIDPLTKASDAIEVNCTDLSIDETVNYLYNYIINSNSTLK
jgi:cytidylate kinase